MKGKFLRTAFMGYLSVNGLQGLFMNSTYNKLFMAVLLTSGVMDS